MTKILQTPILNRISPFDPVENHEIYFQYNDNQSVKNRAIIIDTDTYTEIYDSIQLGMKLSHIIPANTLTAGKRYTIQIQVFDEDGNSSQLSDQMIFYCYSTPVFMISNLINNSIIKNASISPRVTYTQTEGENIASYQYILCDQSKVQLYTSPLYYTLDSSYTFYSLENNATYYIYAVGETEHGITLKSDYIQFIVSYITTPANALFTVTNNYNNGYITIQSNIMDVGYEDRNCRIQDNVLIIENGYLKYNEGYEINDTLYMRFNIQKLPLGVFLKTENEKLVLSLIECCNSYYFRLQAGNYNLFKSLNDSHISVFSQYSRDGILTTLYNLTYGNEILYLEVFRKNNVYDIRITYSSGMEVSE